MPTTPTPESHPDPKLAQLIELLEQQVENYTKGAQLTLELRKLCLMADFAELPLKDMTGSCSLTLEPPDTSAFSPRFKQHFMVLRIDGKEFIRRPLLDTHHDLWPADTLKKYKAKQRAIAARKEREKANG